MDFIIFGCICGFAGFLGGALWCTNLFPKRLTTKLQQMEPVAELADLERGALYYWDIPGIEEKRTYLGPIMAKDKASQIEYLFQRTVNIGRDYGFCYLNEALLVGRITLGQIKKVEDK